MASLHYIPEFLLLPWKAPGSPLWHFNYRSGQFLERPSIEKLFARKNIWSESLEKFLNTQAENFSAKARQKLVVGDQPNPAEFRSLFLLIFLQAARTGFLHGQGTELEAIATYEEVKIAQMVGVAEKKWALCGIQIPGKFRFFFPDNGIFAFPVQAKSGFRWVFALPMDACFCIALLPRDLDIEAVKKQIDYSHLVTWSVCSSNFCHRVVIHPDLYHYKQKKDELAAELLRMRKYVDDQLAAINKLNEVLAGVPSLLADIFSRQ